jgi:hexosaminidase
MDAIQRQIDEFAALKINYLHLHLTDDQGWRIEISSWPRLATHGGSTGSFDSPGGYLTKDEYRQLVRYAADRGMTVVPEVDMPGHTTAALASYPELTCDGVAPPLYTGYEVGISTLCVGRPEVDRFLADVVREVAEMTPGPYLHIGGDESPLTPPEDYDSFLKRAEQEVGRHGKTMIGWAETLTATTPSVSVGQYWFPVPEHAPTTAAVEGGAKVIASPANHTYLDHRYTMEVPEFGQLWAGPVELRNAYEWDPDTTSQGASGPEVLGVEATMFTQFVGAEKDLQFMVFPRLAAVAEVSWTSQPRRDWESFRDRMVDQGLRWERDGVNFHRSPQVDWAP